MRRRKDQLKDLGEFPLIKGKTRVPSQLHKQVEWLLAAEMILDDIVELAKKSPDLDRGAYNPDALQEYLEVFPIDTTTKLSRITGNTEALVKNLLQVHVKDKRKELQDTLKHLKSDWFQCTKKLNAVIEIPFYSILFNDYPSQGLCMY